MAINRGLSCKWRWGCTAMLLMLLLLPLMLQSLFVHGSRLLTEEQQPQRTAEVNNKTNKYTVSSSLSSSSSEEEARSEFDESDRLIPTGPNPLHHKHH